MKDILAFAGSARKDSLNKKALRVAVEAARGAGSIVTLIDLQDFPMPIYNGDLETAEGLPPKAKELKKLMLDHRAFLIAAPEYNSSVTPLLKNSLDWASRSEPGEPALACYRGKIASLLGASPGALGGLRGLVHLRMILGNIGVVVLPEQTAIPKANEAFDPEGRFKDSKLQEKVEMVGKSLATFLAKLRE